MKEHIEKRAYHVEILPPKQDSAKRSNGTGTTSFGAITFTGPAANDLTHHGIEGQAVGIVHILVSGQWSCLGSGRNCLAA